MLVGGESRDPHLMRILADGSGIDVRPCASLTQLDCSRVPELVEMQDNLGPWAVAVGLALRHESLSALRGAA